ncbi:MAG: TerB family tellurite resistance protein [Polyangiaceae bacterium]|nr:TerB family tellurite resistance protein [Polyangiaceae bacterium]
MKSSEALASLRVLLCVARCDGGLSRDERRVMEVVATRAYAPAEPPLDWAAQEADLLLALTEIKSRAARRLTLKAAVAVAAIDGRVSEKEHRILETIYGALSDDDVPLDLQFAEEKYGGRMVDARRELEGMTVDFLHHVSDAQHHGQLTQAEYETLVEKLEEARRARIGLVMSILPPDMKRP